MTTIPNAIDYFVGQSIARHRMAQELSQQDLAAAIGVPVPQWQRYEQGLERIGALLLSAIAHVLQVPLSAFFEGLDRDDEAIVFAEPEVLRLIRAFAAIPDAGLRQYVIGLVEVLAGTGR